LKKPFILLVVLVISILCLLLLFRSFLSVVYLDTKEPPLPAASGEVDFRTESWINLPISIKLDDVQALVNDKAPRTINERRSQEFTRTLKEDWVEYKITRGDITFSPSNGRLAFNIPVTSGSVSAGGQMNPTAVINIGRGVGVQESGDFTGKILGSLSIRLNPDWTVSPDLKLDVEADRAEFRLFNSITISVRGKLEDAIRRKLPEVQKLVANQLLTQLKLKERAMMAWDQMHVTKQVAKSPPSWLSITPVAIAARNITISDDRQIIGGFSLHCALSGIVGAEPASGPTTALPPISIVENLPTDFHIELPVRVDPKTVSDTLRKQFAKEPIKVGRHRVAIREPKIFVVGPKLQIRAELEAASGFLSKRLKGQVSLEGTPSLDVPSKTLTISDLQYTLETRQALAKAGNWLLEPAIIGELKKRSNYSFANDFEGAKSKITNTVPTLFKDGRLAVTVAVRDLSAKRLRLDAGEIFIVGVADGAASVTVTP
jgi:hypothetical protein